MHWDGRWAGLGTKTENSTNVTKMREGRRKSQCRVVSLPPLPLPWLSVERKCLSKYVAHMFTPLPSHVVAMCSGPGRDPRAHMLMAARCVCNSRHSKHPWDPRFRPVARVLIRPFLNFPI
jgi:hypothetical protein